MQKISPAAAAGLVLLLQTGQTASRSDNVTVQVCQIPKLNPNLTRPGKFLVCTNCYSKTGWIEKQIVRNIYEFSWLYPDFSD
jgi:hypothetical protein